MNRNHKQSIEIGLGNPNVTQKLYKRDTHQCLTMFGKRLAPCK